MADKTKEFDVSLADAQGTPVEPLAPEQFDFDAYAAYEAELTERCQAFWAAESRVAVYRRFRVPEVFSYGCRDPRRSLALQLAGLQKSMDYPADVPNFIEPWYGIGTVVSCFGADYIWAEDQAPATEPPLKNLAEALAHEPVPVEQTPIGRRTLEMIDYFLEATGGRVPMSLTDTQSPLDTMLMVVSMTSLLMEVFTNPDDIRTLLGRCADLLIEFSSKQAERIGQPAVWPGHGFASSRAFHGLGMSDDNMLMLSPDQYIDLCAPTTARTGQPFGGPVYHSCGNWSNWIPAIRSIEGLVMVDGAFSAQTDPDPNPPEAIAAAFAGTGIVVNARIVGDADDVADVTKRLWRPGMKLIVVTYCQTPRQQADAYERVHEICQ